MLNDVEPVTDRAMLPLVNLKGSIASKMRWDDRGTYKIKKAKTPRFSSDSYLGEKPFLRDASPRPVASPNHQFDRSP